MGQQVAANGWWLEVVKGRQPGKRFEIRASSLVVGNAVASGGFDLSDLEADGPRRMAAKQAEFGFSGGSLTIRDLESPGGTFVNRQRLLPGQARSLAAGDVIQFASVQLCVKRADQSTSSSVTSTGVENSPVLANGFVFTLASGSTCRTWDDFLTLAAQRWASLREELAAGRLDRFVRSIGRDDLAPPGPAAGSLDERLDTWIGLLPSTRKALPELETIPAVIKVKASPNGGVIRKSFQVSNLGYRLLRSQVKADPRSSSWLKIADEHAHQFTTVETTEITIEVTIPEKLRKPLQGVLFIESNGGSKRVQVVVEKPKAERLDLTSPDGPGAVAADWSERIAQVPPTGRLAALVGVFVGARLVVMLGSSWGSGLSGPAFLFATIGVSGAALFALSRKALVEALPAAVAGGFAGIMAAACAVAACRSIEPMLGSWSESRVVVAALWGIIAAGLAAASTRIFPYDAKPAS